MLWQRKDHYAVLFDIDPSCVISELLRLIRNKDQVAPVREIIISLLPYWSNYLGRNSDQSLISTVFKLALNDQKLFDYVFNELKNEKEQGLRAGDDWSIKEKLSCKCEDCRSLSEFLKSSTTKTTIWPMGKERRSHE